MCSDLLLVTIHVAVEPELSSKPCRLSWQSSVEAGTEPKHDKTSMYIKVIEN